MITFANKNSNGNKCRFEKKVLATDGNGFLGSHIVDELKNRSMFFIVTYLN
jgi:nucleoside-diphosphate-sugar epimerase